MHASQHLTSEKLEVLQVYREGVITCYPEGTHQDNTGMGVFIRQMVKTEILSHGSQCLFALLLG